MVKHAVPAFTALKSVEKYKREVDQWLASTKEPRDELGLLLALALPADAPEGFRDAVLGKGFGIERLCYEDGASVFLDFLERYFAQDSPIAAYRRYLSVQSISRKDGQTIDAYIKDFELKLSEARDSNVAFSPHVESFLLLDGSNVSPDDKYKLLCKVHDAREEAGPSDVVKRELRELFRNDPPGFLFRAGIKEEEEVLEEMLKVENINELLGEDAEDKPSLCGEEQGGEQLDDPSGFEYPKSLPEDPLAGAGESDIDMAVTEEGSVLDVAVSKEEEEDGCAVSRQAESVSGWQGQDDSGISKDRAMERNNRQQSQKV